MPERISSSQSSIAKSSSVACRYATRSSGQRSNSVRAPDPAIESNERRSWRSKSSVDGGSENSWPSSSSQR
jgi:hypothetical protein